MARGRLLPVSAAARRATGLKSATGAASRRGPMCCKVQRASSATAFTDHSWRGQGTIQPRRTQNAPALLPGRSVPNRPSAFDDDQISRSRPELPGLGDGDLVGVLDFAVVRGRRVERRQVVPRHDPVRLGRIGQGDAGHLALIDRGKLDRKSTRLNSSHVEISYAVFCLKKKKNT